MNAFTKSIMQIAKGALKAFETFPAVIIFAFAFMLVTMVRIQIDWPQQEQYNFLFNCLHLSFATGALFSLMAITAAQSRYEKRTPFLTANFLGAAAVAVTFAALYFFGGTDSGMTGYSYATVTGVAAVRVSMAMLVSFLLFILVAGMPKEQSDFSKALFMTHKAFFIALIYGLVIMGGASGVAGAFQALLYHDMSGKVYLYIGTIVGFLAFTIFVGYFPDFRKGNTDDRREIAQKQPKFIEILFGYIMVPIVLALTVVLLIWAAKTILTGTWPEFIRLYSIATAYAVGGIWLHIMITHHDAGLAKFYRRIYPIAALVILAFEAWALVTQLNESGLKTTEYYFGLVWILNVAAAVLLLIIKAGAHHKIIYIICSLAILSVLPVIGFHVLPVTAQVDRLETLLVSEGILTDGKLTPVASEPDLKVRESITDAVDYLAYAQDAKLPGWFEKDLTNSEVFQKNFGFEQVWKDQSSPINNGGYMGTFLILEPEPVDVSNYQWAIGLPDESIKAGNPMIIVGEKGTYEIIWSTEAQNGIPTLKVMLDGTMILEKNMKEYIDEVAKKYPPDNSGTTEAGLQDLSLKIDIPELSVLLVFNNIDINVDTQGDRITYWMNLNMIYLLEK